MTQAAPYIPSLDPVPKARIIITAFQSHDVIHRCIAHLAAQTRKDFEVVIVNNDPQDKSLNDIIWPDKRFSLLHSPANIGFTGGSNMGARGAACEWIITLNPDAFAAPDWFEVLMASADTAPDYAMLSSTLIQEQVHDKLDGAGDAYSIFGTAWRSGDNHPVTALPPKPRNVLGPCGAAAAYRREDFFHLGKFDRHLFCYLEDIDLALRFQFQNKRCLHIPQAIVHHIGSSSTGDDSHFQLYHSYRNHLRVMVKNMPVALLAIMLPLYFISQTWILLRTIFQPNWNARIRGITRGLVNLPTAIKARKTVQKTRQLTPHEVAALLSWSLKDLRRKAIHTLPK